MKSRFFLMLVAITTITLETKSQNTYPWPENGDVEIKGNNTGGGGTTLSLTNINSSNGVNFKLNSQSGIQTLVFDKVDASGNYISRNGYFGFDARYNKFRLIPGSSFTSSVEGLTMDLSGNIGIGTTSPNSSLTVSNSAGGGLITILDTENNELTANPYLAYYYGSSPIRLGYVGYGSSGNKDLYLTNDKGGLRFRDNTGEIMYIKEGKVGVGTINPNSPFSVSSSIGGGLISIIDSENDETIANPYIAYYYGTTQIRLGYVGYGSSGNKDLYLTNDKGGLRFRDNTGEVMFINEGNLLIGKTSQTNNIYKLDVNGSIRANEIKVNTTGADFVFEPDYNLMPLSEVETFINNNKHLPEIDPASKMGKDGVNIGEMNTQLLQKIEELTLYINDMKD